MFPVFLTSATSLEVSVFHVSKVNEVDEAWKREEEERLRYHCHMPLHLW